MNEWPPSENSHGHKKAVEANFGSEQKEVSVVSSAEETEQEILDRKAKEAERIEKIQQEVVSTNEGKTIDESKGKEVHSSVHDTSVGNKPNEGSNHHAESGHSGHETPLTRKQKFFKGLKGIGGNLFFGLIVAMKLGWEKAIGKGGGGGGHSAPKKSSGGHGGGGGHH